MTPAEREYVRTLHKTPMTIRDMNIDAFADGVLAHREGKAFHENPYGGADVSTVQRLSWHTGDVARCLTKTNRPGQSA
jgi:hypothetical protein